MQESVPNVANRPVEKPARQLPWGIFVAGLVAISIVVGGVMFLRSSRLPLMSRTEFEAARALWDESNLSDYSITVQVKGMQPGIYEVGVENGIASSAKFDGRNLKRQRTFGTWSVTGMFDTLSRDLETNDKHDYLMLRAEFDPNFGFPTKYERIEMRTGVHDALQWEVTTFNPKD